MAFEVLMPQLGLTMEEGTVSTWIKHEGDEVKVGDVITLRERSKEQAGFKALREGTGVVTPKWLTFDAQNLTGKVEAMPAREDIDCPIEEHLIVELYSR